jgi:hypothetical protein
MLKNNFPGTIFQNFGKFLLSMRVKCVKMTHFSAISTAVPLYALPGAVVP